MATEQERVGTYREFADRILPRIKGLGYDTVQLMAVQEHPYYGSYGYHVSSLFAPSSRFRHPRRPPLPGGHGPRHGPGRHHGHRPQPCRQKPHGGLGRAGRLHRPVLPPRPARRAPGLGQQALPVRQGRGAAVPAQQHPLLAGGVPVRRLPVRRRNQYALPAPRPGHRFRDLRRLLYRPDRCRRRFIPATGHGSSPRGRPALHLRGRGHERPARPGPARGRRRGGVRLPPGHGDSRQLDTPHQREAGRGLGHRGASTGNCSTAARARPRWPTWRATTRPW